MNERCVTVVKNGILGTVTIMQNKIYAIQHCSVWGCGCDEVELRPGERKSFRWKQASELQVVRSVRGWLGFWQGFLRLHALHTFLRTLDGTHPLGQQQHTYCRNKSQLINHLRCPYPQDPRLTFPCPMKIRYAPSETGLSSSGGGPAGRWLPSGGGGQPFRGLHSV